MEEETKPTFWGYVKSFFKRLGQLCIKYPLAAAATVVLVLLAVMMLGFGKQFQIGGLLSKLWGRKPSGNDVILNPPPDRVDPETGKTIEPGTPDSKGFVQPVAVEIKEPSIFSDPNQITVTTPDGKSTNIDLPTGVKNTDVTKVVMVAPKVFEVHNSDKPTVDAGKLLEDLNK